MKLWMRRNKKRKSIHYSIDDTNNLFFHLTNDHYPTAFEEPILSLFKQLHETYGCTISCFCFMEFGGFSLKQATDCFRSEFQENSGWLKFGFHGTTPETRYETTTAEQVTAEYHDGIETLRRIVGSESLDYVPRLHNWNISHAALEALCAQEGLQGILASADNLPANWLSKWKTNRLRKSGCVKDSKSGAWIVNTDLLLETIPIEGGYSWIERFLQASRERQHLEVFTHEWILRGENANTVVEHLNHIAKWAMRENRAYIFWNTGE